MNPAALKGAIAPLTAVPLACLWAARRAHEADLRGYLRHRLADADAAEDVLRDVFVKAMRHGQGLAPPTTRAAGSSRGRAIRWRSGRVARTPLEVLAPSMRWRAAWHARWTNCRKRTQRPAR